MEHALRLSGISKSFDGKLALQLASFEAEWGEVHALLGENGAGKSTIMNVLAGIYTPDEGKIQIENKSTQVKSPSEATQLGIGMVHQHYKLVGRFTVAENILLACGDQLGIKTTNEATEHLLAKAEEVGFTVHPDAVIEKLSIAGQQRVEILKVLLLGARIVILDEPTAVLTEQESKTVLSFARRMAQSGHAVILITHKLREVTEFSDRVTVMRHGETVLSGHDTADLDVDSLARHMVGEEINNIEPIQSSSGESCLVIKDLHVPHPDGRIGVDALSLEVRSGEILGIAGVGGNGQQTLADALTGLAKCEAGSINVKNVDITNVNVAERRAAGMRTVPSDRFTSGLIANMSVAENLAMTSITSGRYGSPFNISRKNMQLDAEKVIAQHEIHGATPNRQSKLLSGGNAQKLLLGRELRDDVNLLIAHSPTRGLDVKACNTVHSLIKKSVENGAACLMISEDIEEIFALSTRIAVMSRGKIVGELAAAEATPEKIGTLMMGHA